ncbi:MAG TPA: GyrI-like domain-containing protein [Candidatus Megaira endosymbiont of Nemacystus decipiens]|nr:GyrI-like domain-containing protein [Candidatus Megaera endosymbiont of Nemacystus decipiens]
MKTSNESLSEIKLVGITARISNSLEGNPETAKIGQTIGNYFENNLSQKIAHRVKPGTTYCAYTEYETDENGQYTYFVGEEVNSLDKIPDGFETLIIPASNYTKFECGPGGMPRVCIDAWKEIWGMQEADLGGKRTYIADFEIYDERAKDYGNTILDIYIGVTQ